MIKINHYQVRLWTGSFYENTKRINEQDEQMNRRQYCNIVLRPKHLHIHKTVDYMTRKCEITILTLNQFFSAVC